MGTTTRETGAPVYISGASSEVMGSAVVNTVHQEQVVAGSVSQNVVEIPTVQEVVQVQEIPEVQTVERIEEVKKYHKDSGKKVTETSLLTAIEHANAYLANNERLPDHWDREILFNMGGDSSTEGSSEDEEAGQLSDGDDAQSPEKKDHLVAELYKHMDDRGTPINRTPYIDHKEVDLYMLFRLVQKLGGSQRVTNNNQWRLVAKRLGFETNWCVNQVRVHYKRYLQSFEELYKTLGCTL